MEFISVRTLVSVVDCSPNQSVVTQVNAARKLPNTGQLEAAVNRLNRIWGIGR